MAFSSFSCPIVPRGLEDRPPCLITSFRRKEFCLSLVSMMLAVCTLYILFITIKEILSSPSFLISLVFFLLSFFLIKSDCKILARAYSLSLTQAYGFSPLFFFFFPQQAAKLLTITLKLWRLLRVGFCGVFFCFLFLLFPLVFGQIS